MNKTLGQNSFVEPKGNSKLDVIFESKDQNGHTYSKYFNHISPKNEKSAGLSRMSVDFVIKKPS